MTEASVGIEARKRKQIKKRVIVFCLFYPFLATVLLDILKIDGGVLWRLIACFGPPIGAIFYLPIEDAEWKWFTILCICLLYVVVMLAPLIYFSLWATCALGFDCI